MADSVKNIVSQNYKVKQSSSSNSCGYSSKSLSQRSSLIQSISLDNPIARKLSNAAVEPQRPEWYQHLDQHQMARLWEIFKFLKKNTVKCINVDQITTSLQDLDSKITRSEVESVLKDVKDKSGVVDFNEFLYALCSKDRCKGTLETFNPSHLEAAHCRLYTRRQKVFYSAIAKFTFRFSLGDIERHYKNKSKPHVLKHYTVSQCLQGLSDKQLWKMYCKTRNISKQLQDTKSPYIQPLPFVWSVSKSSRKISIKKCNKEKMGKIERKKVEVEEDKQKISCSSLISLARIISVLSAHDKPKVLKSPLHAME
ncbi:uncharacterized protein LOC143253994 [Tachypleus tridentatus]|uniref:uncharacterized protein LOC143253994 n=1 Tax=Tachypleus tridentatus TaxID=6853 RepID=UPI003FD57E01